MGWVYGIQCGEFIKVGCAKNMAVRVHAMKLHNPLPLKIILRRRSKNAYWLERRIHKLLVAKSIGREWFSATVDEVKAAADQAGIDQKKNDIEQEIWERESSERAERRCQARSARRVPNVDSAHQEGQAVDL